MEDAAYATQQILRHVSTLNVENDAECLAVYGAVRWFAKDLKEHCEEHGLTWGGTHSEQTTMLIWHLQEVCRLDYEVRPKPEESHRRAAVAAEALLREIQSLKNDGFFAREKRK